jgi:hypothetical protein
MQALFGPICPLAVCGNSAIDVKRGAKIIGFVRLAGWVSVDLSLSDFLFFSTDNAWFTRHYWTGSVAVIQGEGLVSRMASG